MDGNLDLSDVPVPEADRKANEPTLSAAERKGLPIQISVVPVGYVPAPIIYLDENGMPKEKYRDPLEYPPAVYHVKTESGTIRVLGGQNQVGPATRVPRVAQISLSYEVPMGDNDVAPAPGKAKASLPLKSIGTFAVPPAATHLVVVLWKDPGAKKWNNPNYKVINVSPTAVKKNEAVVVNVSGRDLALHRGDSPYRIKSGFMGKVELAMNEKGQMPMVLASADGADWHQLSKTVIGPRKDERVFVVAWPAPVGPAQPAGVAFSAVTKRLAEAKPFEQPRP